MEASPTLEGARYYFIGLTFIWGPFLDRYNRLRSAYNCQKGEGEGAPTERGRSANLKWALFADFCWKCINKYEPKSEGGGWGGRRRGRLPQYSKVFRYPKKKINRNKKYRKKCSKKSSPFHKVPSTFNLKCWTYSTLFYLTWKSGMEFIFCPQEKSSK